MEALRATQPDAAGDALSLFQKAREMAERGEIREEISAECDMPMHIVDVLRDLATARATVERVRAWVNDEWNHERDTEYRAGWASGYESAKAAIRAAIGGESK